MRGRGLAMSSTANENKFMNAYVCVCVFYVHLLRRFVCVLPWGRSIATTILLECDRMYTALCSFSPSPSSAAPRTFSLARF